MDAVVIRRAAARSPTQGDRLYAVSSVLYSCFPVIVPVRCLRAVNKSSRVYCTAVNVPCAAPHPPPPNRQQAAQRSLSSSNHWRSASLSTCGSDWSSRSTM
eukprot:5138999-Prymnesium_polylepis.2